MGLFGASIGNYGEKCKNTDVRIVELYDAHSLERELLEFLDKNNIRSSQILDISWYYDENSYPKRVILTYKLKKQI